MVTRSTFWLAASLAALAVTGPAMAATITLYNTGVDNNGVPLPDGSPEQHYQVITTPPTSAYTPTTINSNYLGIPGYGAGFPASSWIGDDNLSSWISTTPIALVGAGIWDYQVTFSLAGLYAATAVITGKLAADDWLTGVSINGVSTGITAGVNNVQIGAYTAWTDFTINKGFVTGTNTLDFYVDNYFSNSATGLRVEMTGVADALTGAVPEPASWAMMIMGFAMAGAALRRQRQTVTAKITFT